jgi:hypothetical protein
MRRRIGMLRAKNVDSMEFAVDFMMQERGGTVTSASSRGSKKSNGRCSRSKMNWTS